MNPITPDKCEIKKFTFKVLYLRQTPDPLNDLPDSEYNIKHYSFFTRPMDIKEGMPNNPNIRHIKNIDLGVYEEVYDSLTNKKDPSFHLKNSGIRIVAHEVKELNDREVTVTIKDCGSQDAVYELLKSRAKGENLIQGILNGGHTYEVIQEARKMKECPENQWIKVDVDVNIPKDLLLEMAYGLNNSIALRQITKINGAGELEWLKNAIKGKSYENAISYEQNQKGYDVRKVLGMLAMFLPQVSDESKNKENRKGHPIKAMGRDSLLENYNEGWKKFFKKISLIVHDILVLSDEIQLGAPDAWREAGHHVTEGTAIFRDRIGGGYHFIFADRDGQKALWDGVKYPMLGAFRMFIKENEDGMYVWKIDFEKIKEILKIAMPSMVVAADAAAKDLAKPDAIAKSLNTWVAMYTAVKDAYDEYREKA